MRLRERVRIKVPRARAWKGFLLLTLIAAIWTFAARQPWSAPAPALTNVPTEEVSAAGMGAVADPDSESQPATTLEGGGGRNVVMVNNQNDDTFRIRGSAQLNRIPGPNVGPVNLAKAESSCTDCQTMAVALQINLYQAGAPKNTPQNAAVALNIGCTRCVTIALAYQYTIPAENVNDQVARDADALAREMDRTLHAIQQEAGNLTVAEAVARVEAVIADFQSLAAYLDERQDQSEETNSPAAEETAAPTESTPAATTPTASTDGGTTAPTATEAAPIDTTPSAEPTSADAWATEATPAGSTP